MLQGFSGITGHAGTRLKMSFFELLSGRSGIRVPSGAPATMPKALILQGFRLSLFSALFGLFANC
jgi:hypothetical protein